MRRADGTVRQVATYVAPAGRSDFDRAQTVFAASGRALSLAADGDGRAALAFTVAGARRAPAPRSTSDRAALHGRRRGDRTGGPELLPRVRPRALNGGGSGGERLDLRRRRSGLLCL